MGSYITVVDSMYTYGRLPRGHDVDRLFFASDELRLTTNSVPFSIDLKEQEQVKTLAKDVYTVIRHRVANGKLPPGIRVSELALSKELGVSRAPIREAIGKLAAEGLLERMPNVGTFVKKPSRAELQELYEFRGWLEGEAAAKAASTASEESISRIKKCCDEMDAVAEHHRSTGEKFTSVEDLERWALADLSFHLAVVKACGNGRALSVLANQHLLSQSWSTTLEPQDLGILLQTQQEHTAIFQAIQSRDPELACRLLREHIDEAMRLALVAFDRRDSASLMDQETVPEAIEEIMHRLEARQA